MAENKEQTVVSLKQAKVELKIQRNKNKMKLKYLTLVRARAKQKLLFLPHALRQMNRPDRMISPSEVRKVISEGEILENYPEDARGHSCLLIGTIHSNRIIHVVCAPKDEYLAIITAYIPSEEQWSCGFKIRRKK